MSVGYNLFIESNLKTMQISCSEKLQISVQKSISSGSFSLGRKILDFIDAELKNQIIGMQLATEIKLYPEISVITRYWSIELVNDNKAWIP